MSKITYLMLSTMVLLGCQKNTDAHAPNKEASLASEAVSASVSLPKSIATPEGLEAFKEQLNARFAKAELDTKVKDVTATPVDNLLWVTLTNNSPLFVSADGQYIMTGDVLKLGDGGLEDVKSDFLSGFVKDTIAKLPVEDMIIYKPQVTKKIIYVFTDVDCGYCRKFHSELKDHLAKGIEVRYLAWPRSDKSIPIMETIWCSADRNKAMDLAKSMQSPPPAAQCKSPIKTHVETGFELGINGTPAIYDEQGRQLGGYVPHRELVKMLGL